MLVESMTCSCQYPLRTSLPADGTDVLPSQAFLLKMGVCLSLLLATLLLVTLLFCQPLVSVVVWHLITLLTGSSLLSERGKGGGGHL